MQHAPRHRTAGSQLDRTYHLNGHLPAPSCSASITSIRPFSSPTSGMQASSKRHSMAFYRALPIPASFPPHSAVLRAISSSDLSLQLARLRPGVEPVRKAPVRAIPATTSSCRWSGERPISPLNRRKISSEYLEPSSLSHLIPLELFHSLRARRVLRAIPSFSDQSRLLRAPPSEPRKIERLLPYQSRASIRQSQLCHAKNTLLALHRLRLGCLFVLCCVQFTNCCCCKFYRLFCVHTVSWAARDNVLLSS
ncbi:hypothetical protein V8F33_004189 [Rhypophila sp. PSN 637]